jgi:hypothetical protein
MPIMQCHNNACRIRKPWNQMLEQDRRFCCLRCHKEFLDMQKQGTPAKQLLLFQMTNQPFYPHTRE